MALPARFTLSSTPISPSSITRLVPPEEKKGRLMPVLGMVLVTTAMFMSTCRVIWAMIPMPSKAPNRSGARREIWMPCTMRAANSPIQTRAPTKPSSSQSTEKIKSLVASGSQSCFWLELPMPTPNRPPLPMV